MPEIPEMEIYQNYLNQYVSGKYIQDIEIHREKSINLPSAEFVRLVRGQEIKEVRRMNLPTCQDNLVYPLL